MSLFNDSWCETKRTAILKCWTKNKCLSENPVEEARDICSDLTQNEPDVVLNAPVSHEDAQSIFEDLASVFCSQETNHQAQELTAGVQDVEYVAELLQVLNTEVEEDTDVTSQDIANNELQTLYDQFCLKENRTSQTTEVQSLIQEPVQPRSIAEICNEITEIAAEHAHVEKNEVVRGSLQNVLGEMQKFIFNN